MKTKKLTILAMFTAVSLIIFIIESQFPPLAPIPGIKLGLANIITLLLLVWFGWREAFAVLILRIGLGSIFAGQIMSLMYSLAGGLLCFIVMSVCMRFFKKDGIWITSVSACIDHIRRNNRRIYRYSGTLYRQKQSPFQACRAMG